MTKKPLLNLDQFLEYITLKSINVKSNYQNLNIQESDLIKILMASFLDKFGSKLSLEFYEHPLTESEIDFVIDKYDFSQIRNEITLDFKIPNEIEELKTKVKIKTKGNYSLFIKTTLIHFPQIHTRIGSIQI